MPQPSLSGGYDMRLERGRASGTYSACSGNCECQRQFTGIELGSQTHLAIANERDVCDETGQRVCTWKILSTSITGPLN